MNPRYGESIATVQLGTRIHVLIQSVDWQWQCTQTTNSNHLKKITCSLKKEREGSTWFSYPFFRARPVTRRCGDGPQFTNVCLHCLGLFVRLQGCFLGCFHFPFLFTPMIPHRRWAVSTSISSPNCRYWLSFLASKCHTICELKIAWPSSWRSVFGSRYGVNATLVFMSIKWSIFLAVLSPEWTHIKRRMSNSWPLLLMRHVFSPLVVHYRATGTCFQVCFCLSTLTEFDFERQCRIARHKARIISATPLAPSSLKTR